MSSQSNYPIHIVIADRSSRARDGLRAILKTQPGIEVVGDAEEGDELLSLVAARQPHIVILDECLQCPDGIETIRALKSNWPKVKIVVFSLYNDRRAEALTAGADTFLIKCRSNEDVISIILSLNLAGEK